MRYIALLCAFALCAGCLCACGKTGPAPVDAEVSASAPAEQPVSFSLPSLPEIGSYTNKKPTYFYDAPLKEFRASDDYGRIIPYCVASNGQVGSCGFMTADGKIITDAIYSSVEVLESKGRYVYSARLKVFFFDDEEETEGASVRSAKQNMTLLISSDGSKFIKLPEVTPVTGYDDSVFIECRIWAHDGGYVGDTFYLYDFDLNLVKDLTGYGVVNGRVTADSPDRFVVADWEKEVYFENGEPVKNVAKSDGTTSLPNGMSYDRSQVYNENGDVVCSFSSHFECTYKDRIDALLIEDEGNDRIVKIKDGKVAAEYRITDDSLSSMSVVFPDGECRIVVSLGESWDEITGYLVLDEDLNLLKTIDVSGASFVRLVTHEWEDDSFGFILLGHGDRTDLCDLSGETVATLPFAYDSWPDITDGNMFFTRDGEPTYRFCFADRSLTEYAPLGPGKTGESCSFFNDRVLIRGYVLATAEGYYDPERGDYRYLLSDPATGETLYENVTDLCITELGEQSWIAFSANGAVYVYDGEMNLITSFADGYYA